MGGKRSSRVSCSANFSAFFATQRSALESNQHRSLPRELPGSLRPHGLPGTRHLKKIDNQTQPCVRKRSLNLLRHVLVVSLSRIYFLQVPEPTNNCDEWHITACHR